MTPTTAYKRLNQLLWHGRLPKATVIFVDSKTIPHIHGITLDDKISLFMRPVIMLNRASALGPTLVHEMLHVAEPTLQHGVLFEALVQRYWRFAKKNIKGLQKPHKSKPVEIPNVE